MRISDWSSDVCSSDLTAAADAVNLGQLDAAVGAIPVDSNNTGGFAAPSATGDNSLAVGNGAEASGEYSTATGVLSQASGEYSTATGRASAASGLNSNATGRASAAPGDSSTAPAAGSHRKSDM